jgi:hypothetical protein
MFGVFLCPVQALQQSAPAAIGGKTKRLHPVIALAFLTPYPKILFSPCYE